MRFSDIAIMKRAAIAAALLVSAFAAAPAVANTTTSIVGYEQGRMFASDCGGDALVGFRIRQGDGLDLLQPLCAAMHKERYLDPPYANGDRIGGNGGKLKEVVCRGNSFVSGIDVAYDGGVVNDINIYCVDVEDGAITQVGTDWENEGSSFVGVSTVACSRSEVGYGVVVYASNMVHGIALECTADPFEVAAAPQGNGGAASPGSGNEWSAFAASDQGDWGYGVHQADEQTASKLALDGCGGSGAGCKVFWTTRDQCVAFAESRAGGYWYAAGGGASESKAQANAVRFCQDGSAPANSCTATVAECR